MTPNELDRLADALAERLAARGVHAAAAAAHDNYVDVHGAAEVLGCSVPTVERLTRAGKIPSVKLNRLRRYRRADLLAVSVKGGGDHA